MTDFSWPWHYDFPPFFTIQKNSDTKAKQIEAWCSLVLSYHQHHKIFKLHVSDAVQSPLFCNKAIDRRLPKEGVMEVLETLCKKGNVLWDDKAKNSCLVLWKTVEQWADLIYSWVSRTGLANSVCTLHEITQGTSTTSEQFYGLEDWLLDRALKSLQSRGKAELIGDEGVKFFS